MTQPCKTPMTRLEMNQYQAEHQTKIDAMTDEELVRFQNAGQPEEYVLDKVNGLAYNKGRIEMEYRQFEHLLAYIDEWVKPLKLTHLNSAYKKAYPDRYHYKHGVRETIQQIKNFIDKKQE